MKLNTKSLWEMYNNVMLGRWDPVVLIGPFRDLLEANERLRKNEVK